MVGDRARSFAALAEGGRTVADGHRGVTGVLRDVVTEFRAATSPLALVEQAPEVIARLGFDRVLISRVDDGIWLPESMFVRRDPCWAEAIIRAGLEEPTALDSVIETDVVGSGSAFIVDEVQSHPRVCRPIAVISRSENYAVAPITVGETVVGMLHADCYFQRRPVHRDECDTLAVTAECLAAHLSRLLILEQVRALGDAAGRSWSPISPITRVGDPVRVRTAAPHAELTGRELDVMRLMADGESNYRIGRRLAISEGTVKTHVTHILQKLNAANRAQAVSLWLGRI